MISKMLFLQERAVDFYRRAAEHEWAAFSYFKLGDCYLKGVGVPQSDEEALCWYFYAVSDYYFNMHCIGSEHYSDKTGMSIRNKKAIGYIIRCAEQGVARAQWGLAELYRLGISVPQNYENAVAWYTKAVNQDDACAMFELGSCYARGEGVQKNYEKALELYIKAAERDVVAAITRL